MATYYDQRINWRIHDLEPIPSREEGWLTDGMGMRMGMNGSGGAIGAKAYYVCRKRERESGD